MGELLKGTELAKSIRDDIKIKTKGFMIKPCLAVIQVGDNPASNIYIKKKEEACNEAGIYFKLLRYNENALEKEITNKIVELNNDEYVNGIIVQLPLPDYLNSQRIVNHITSTKDVDGLNDINTGRLFDGKDGMFPCTALGVMELLKSKNIEIAGKNVVIVGRGKLVGKPLMGLLLKNDATVTVCHSKTIDLKSYTNKADILISCTGVKGLITSDYIKDGAVIIDTGVTVIDGKTYGDVDTANVIDKVSYITPPIGGVGPMTVAMLLSNTIKSYEKNRR